MLKNKSVEDLQRAIQSCREQIEDLERREGGAREIALIQRERALYIAELAERPDGRPSRVKRVARQWGA